MSIGRSISWVVVLVIALPGLLSALVTLFFLRMVLPALWTGVFERPDFRDGTDDVRIVRATDPDWYWGNVEFYSVLAAVSCAIAAGLLLPLAFRIAAVIRSKVQKGPTS